MTEEPKVHWRQEGGRAFCSSRPPWPSMRYTTAMKNITCTKCLKKLGLLSKDKQPEKRSPRRIHRLDKERVDIEIDTTRERVEAFARAHGAREHPEPTPTANIPMRLTIQAKGKTLILTARVTHLQTKTKRNK